MGARFEGSFQGDGVRVAIVASRFNHFVTSHLVEGCKDALRRHGVADEAIDEAWVPGAFELALVARKLAAGPYDAVVCLGCVIRGSTPHFDYVAGEAAKGIARASEDSGKPVIFGVLTTDSIEQAIERAGTKAGNKGWDAGMTALEMVQLLRALPGATA